MLTNNILVTDEKAAKQKPRAINASIKQLCHFERVTKQQFLALQNGNLQDDIQGFCQRFDAADNKTWK